MKREGISQLPVLDEERLAGIVTELDLLTVLVEGRATMNTQIAEVMNRKVTTCGLDEPVSTLPERFHRGEVALIVDEKRNLLGLLSKVDLIEYLSRRR